MVYLLNSQYSENQPDSWLCGGVLISTTKVLTAAACLTEVSHIYVIAGYKKYVNSKKIMKNDCTRAKKQKIVKIIIPKAFNSSMWVKFDIGIGIVEKPYNFFDMSYRRICSYEPEAIAINYDVKREKLHTSVVALGWGGRKARQPDSHDDINSEYLMEAHTIITNKTLCLKQLPKSADYYLLCTEPLTNNLKTDENIRRFKIYQDNCNHKPEDIFETIPTECLGNEEVLSLRKANGSDPSLYGIDHENGTLITNKTYGDLNILRRKQRVDGHKIGGICQNDHGGPLVATIGDIEIVIGVSLNSVYNYDYQCKGPFLYLSTARSSVLIKCLLSSAHETRNICEKYDYLIKEYNVTWPEQSKKEEQKCQNGDCLAVVRMRPQMRLLDLVDDQIEEK